MSHSGPKGVKNAGRMNACDVSVPRMRRSAISAFTRVCDTLWRRAASGAYMLMVAPADFLPGIEDYKIGTIK